MHTTSSAGGFDSDYKIAILTCTASQGEEEYYAAMSLTEKYGDKVVRNTCPDNFSYELETAISKLIDFAGDSSANAIIFVRVVQGATALL